MREDLYYRLAVVEIGLPPLRDRIDDVKLLATNSSSGFSRESHKKDRWFQDDAWEWVPRVNWPGNVRELKNTIERGVIMARTERIGLSDLMPRHLSAPTDTPGERHPRGGLVSLADASVRWWCDLRATGGDVRRAARRSGWRRAASATT